MWRPGERDAVTYQSAVPLRPGGSEEGIEPYSPINRVCLLPFGPREQQRVGAMIERRGACFAGGDARATPVAPSFAFPADRRYVAVASGGGGQACALDEAGRLSCCGLTALRLGGAEAFQAIDASRTELCALGKNGSVSCWAFDRGVARRLPGAFSSVSVGMDGACGV